MSETYNILEARLILAADKTDFELFRNTYTVYRGNSPSSDLPERVMEILNRVKLEGMKNEPEDKRIGFLKRCIELIDLPDAQKRFFKLLAEFNSIETSLDEKEAMLLEMKAVCPENRLKEVLQLELSLANVRLDFNRIASVLEEINNLQLRKGD